MAQVCVPATCTTTAAPADTPPPETPLTRWTGGDRWVRRRPPQALTPVCVCVQLLSHTPAVLQERCPLQADAASAAGPLQLLRPPH